VIPIVNIFAVWIFAFAPWPILDGDDASQLKPLNKKFVISISVVIIALLLSFSIAAYQVIPEFIKLLKGLDVENHILTKIVIYTYKYWIILPIIASLLSVKLAVAQNITVQKQFYFLSILIGMLVIAIVFFALTIFGMYAPILALE